MAGTCGSCGDAAFGLGQEWSGLAMGDASKELNEDIARGWSQAVATDLHP